MHKKRKQYNREKRLKFAQNYIKNPALVRKLLNKAELKKTDTVLEIGPGEGIFTAELLKRVKKLIAIEIDAENISLLKKRFKNEINEGKLILIHQDALAFDKKLEFKKLNINDYKIVASIPYNISSQIFKRFLLRKPFPLQAYFTVQKEFAKRALNSKGELFGVFLNSFYSASILHEFKREDFSPKPAVDSVFISLKLKELDAEFLEHLGEYKNLLQKAFVQPIKSTKSFFSDILPDKTLQRFVDSRKLKLKDKVNNLSSQDWLEIFKIILHS